MRTPCALPSPPVPFRLARTAAVEAPEETAALAQAKAEEIWAKLSPWLPGPMPRTIWNETTSPYTGYVDRVVHISQAYTYAIAHIELYGLTTNLGILLHEWAHARQEGKAFCAAKLWRVEGGAQLFARQAARKIGLDPPITTDQYNSWVRTFKLRYGLLAVREAMKGQFNPSDWEGWGGCP